MTHEEQTRDLIDTVRDLGWETWYNRATGNIEVYWDVLDDSCHATIFIKDGKVWGELQDDHEICCPKDVKKLEEYLNDPWEFLKDSA